MPSSALTSLAILKVNWDRRGVDYIENFVPFIVECARNSPEDIISLPMMHQMATDRFRLTLPHHALRLIILRATKRGYFRRKNNILYIVREKCTTLDFETRKNTVEATYDRVISRLRTFALERHRTSWSAIAAETAILDFLGDDSLTFLFNIAEPQHRHQNPDHSRFIVASFIEFSQKSDAALLSDLELLARGQLFANALYLPGASGIRKRFRNTAIFLDTTFLSFATGFAGPDRAAPCLELIDLLGRYGADIRCFSGTRNEFQGILDACASRLKLGDLQYAHGPTIEYFIEANKTASDLELMLARLPATLKRFGIKVVEPPPFTEYAYQIDEYDFEAHLERSIGYKNPKARVHDVNCISAIARLRRGRGAQDVEESRALFVTTNHKLVQATRQYCSVHNLAGDVSLAITDHGLSNLLWLKDPTVAPALPRKQLIADAYAAMQPSDSLWNLYLKEIASLKENGKVTPEDYMLLRYSLSAKFALMDLTHGQENAFTDGTIPEILEFSKEAVRAELNTKYETEKQGRIRAEEELQGRNERSLGQRQRLRVVARRIARIARNSILVPTYLLLAYGVFQTFPWAFPSITQFWFMYLSSFALLFVFCLGLGNLIYGATVMKLASWLEEYVSSTILSVLFKIGGFPEKRGDDI